MILGLIVNPIAGIGGRVGLKGSDGAETQREAFSRGAEPQAHLRAKRALEELLPLKERLEVITPPGAMGAELRAELVFTGRMIGQAHEGATSAEDTIRAAEEMSRVPVDLLLFAGGDGTARDIYTAVGTKIPVLGIPAGVKIYSAVFATNPRAAGEVAAAYLKGERIRLHEAEVIDLDEEAYRSGKVATRLYGYLRIPYRPHLVQNRKVSSSGSEGRRLEAIAAQVIEMMKPGWLYVVGPGTTTRAIAGRLGYPKTLVGVDAYTHEGVAGLDLSESRLLALLEQMPAKVIVTPIGGQGFLFGRGNQQISAKVIRKVGRENIWVVSLAEKVNSLKGEPLLVDTGEAEVDEMLSGYLTVIVGYAEKVVYRVA